LSGFSALENCLSISSASMKYFRTSFLKPDSIMVTSSSAFKKQYTYSKDSLLWLNYIKTKYNFLEMECATVGKEVRIPGSFFTLDGYVEVDKRKLGFEFLGCWFHGHTCIKKNRHVIQTSLGYRSLNMKYNDYLIRKKFVEMHLTKLESIWEC